MVITNPALPDNPIVFANDAFQRLTGYDRDELMGRNCRFLQGSQTDQDTIRRLREAVETGTDISVDILNYRKDGSTFPVEAHLFFHEIDGRRYIAGLTRDISERVASVRAMSDAQRRLEERAVESAHHSERVAGLLQAVIDAAPDLVYIKDRQGRYQYINSAVADLAGIPRTAERLPLRLGWAASPAGAACGGVSPVSSTPERTRSATAFARSRSTLDCGLRVCTPRFAR